MSLTPDELKQAMIPLIEKHGEALISIASYRNVIQQLAHNESPQAAAMLDITTLRLIGSTLRELGKTAEQFAAAMADYEKTHKTLIILSNLED